MSDDGGTGGGAFHAIDRIVRGLGFGGATLVLWTVVVVTALFRGDRAIVDELWPRLYWTWMALAGIWLVSLPLTARAARKALPPPQVAAAEPATARLDAPPATATSSPSTPPPVPPKTK